MMPFFGNESNTTLIRPMLFTLKQENIKLKKEEERNSKQKRGCKQRKMLRKQWYLGS